MFAVNSIEMFLDPRQLSQCAKSFFEALFLHLDIGNLSQSRCVLFVILLVGALLTFADLLIDLAVVENGRKTYPESASAQQHRISKGDDPQTTYRKSVIPLFGHYIGIAQVIKRTRNQLIFPSEQKLLERERLFERRNGTGVFLLFQVDVPLVAHG